MKRATMLIFMMMILVGMGFAQQYGEYDPPYENNEYADYDDDYLAYDYGYSSAQPYLRDYNGPVYYWTHPYRDVYFVLVGRRVFVIPVYELNSIWHRLGWSLVSMDRFIHLSCFGLPYYDNYVRFNYYFSHYRRYRYGSYYNRYLRTHYRSYYRNRRHNRNYYRDRSRVLRKSRLTTTSRYGNRALNRRVIRKTPGTSRYTSRRTGTRAYTRSGTTGYRSSRTYTRKPSDRSRQTIRRSTSKRGTSVKRSTRRSTSSRSVQRSRTSRKSSSNKSSARSGRKARRR